MKLSSKQAENLRAIKEAAVAAVAALGVETMKLERARVQQQNAWKVAEEKEAAFLSAVRDAALAAGLDGDKAVSLDLDAGTIDPVPPVVGSVVPPEVARLKRR